MSGGCEVNERVLGFDINLCFVSPTVYSPDTIHIINTSRTFLFHFRVMWKNKTNKQGMK